MKTFTTYNRCNEAMMTLNAFNLDEASLRLTRIYGITAIRNRINRITEKLS